MTSQLVEKQKQTICLTVKVNG